MYRDKLKLKEYQRQYRLKNRERRLAQKKEWRLKNQERYKQALREAHVTRMANDPTYKLSRNLRKRLNQAIKKNTRSGSAVRDLGCSINELKAHIESKWQPGMSWENWSKTGWHIDHIKPLSSFDLSDPEQIRIACHYTNLRPLWASENLSKGSR